MRVIIAGGGIGGLTATLALRQPGIEADVNESTILTHAVRALTEPGLGDALARGATGRAPEGFASLDDVISATELRETATRCKRLAGFDPAWLDQRESFAA